MRVQVTPSLPEIPSRTRFFISIDKKLNICYSNVVEADSPAAPKEKRMMKITENAAVNYAIDEIETEVFYRTGWHSDERFRDYIETLLLDLFGKQNKEVQE